jgi:3-hydroxybutyryl-CoA dehydrogenase
MRGRVFPSNESKSNDRNIEHIGVAGSGTMGTQLVAYLLSRSLKVTLFTRNPTRAKTLLNDFLTERYPKLLDISDTDQLTVSSDLNVLCETQIIIETMKEDLMIKRDFIRRVIEKDSSVIIGSCTSSLTLKQVSNGIQDSGRIQVIHFSNPVAKMKVIELVPSNEISDHTKLRLEEFFSKLEHEVVEVPDIPGYVINSIIFAMIEKANLLTKKHGIPSEDIDTLMRVGCGFPMGPFEIEKLIGAQTVDLIRKNLSRNS